MNMTENLTCVFWMYPIVMLRFLVKCRSKEGIFCGFKGLKSVNQVNINR